MAKIEAPEEVLAAIDLLNSPPDRNNLEKNNADRKEAADLIMDWKLDVGKDVDLITQRDRFVKEKLGVYDEVPVAPPSDVIIQPEHGDTVKARKRQIAIYNHSENPYR